MRLQVWAEVDLPDPDEDETVNDYVRAFQDEYPSLCGLVADYIDDTQGDRSRPTKVIVTLNGRRVVLAMHPTVVCPDCRNVMTRTDIGRFLFVCVCGHREGDTQR